MSKNLSKSDEQDIDFGSITQGIGNSFRRINSFIYECMRFVVRNIIVLVILLVLGVSLGVFLDKTQKVYENQIIVSPNFGSVDYLYSKINLIDAKIRERDTVFLKSMGIQNPNHLLEINVNPVIDVYKFVNSNENNYKLLELMAGDGDIKKIMVENTTSKNYVNHIISFSTLGMTTREKTIEPILKYLNNTEFFSKVQREYLANVKIKMAENDRIIAQIDNVLNDFATTSNSGPSDKLVYYNENTQLNDVIKTKDELIKEQGNLRLDMVSLDKIVKDNSVITNVRDTKAINGKMKLVLPFLLIMLYLIGYALVAFYRKQSVKAGR